MPLHLSVTKIGNLTDNISLLSVYVEKCYRHCQLTIVIQSGTAKHGLVRPIDDTAQVIGLEIKVQISPYNRPVTAHDHL